MDNIITKEQRMVVLLSRITFRSEDIAEMNQIMKDKLFDWFQFLKYILYHRTAALCWKNIHQLRINCSIPHYIDDMLSYIYSGNKQRNEEKITEAKKIVDICEKQGLTLLPVKGAKLIPEMYKDFGLRYSSDSDFLIREEDTIFLSDILKELGYIQGFCDRRTKIIKPASRDEIQDYKNRLNNIFPYIKYSGSHLYPTISIDFRYALGMHKNRQVINDMIKQYKTSKKVSPEYYLLHLCAHFSEEARKSIDIFLCKDFNMIKLCDIRESILQARATGSCELVKFAKKYSLQEEVYFALYYLYLVYRDEFVVNWMEDLNIEDSSFIDQFGKLGHEPDSVFKKTTWERIFSCYNLDDIRQLNTVIDQLTFKSEEQ